jgi:hypothetical protein
MNPQFRIVKKGHDGYQIYQVQMKAGWWDIFGWSVLHSFSSIADARFAVRAARTYFSKGKVVK